jgi:bifunctional DNase/RNase
MRADKKLTFGLSLLFLLSCAVNAAQNSGVVETKVKTLTLDPNTQAPIVLLETLTDKQLLPIWIDVPEARAIALELEHVKTPRPLTHDLIRNILQELGAELNRVTITDLRNGTYYAILTVRLKGQELQIDSRPSDAIAVALRMKTPIYVATQVFDKSKSVPAPGVRPDRGQKTLAPAPREIAPQPSSILEVKPTDVAEKL